MALTKRVIDTQKWNPDGPKAQIIWDGDLKGFGCRVYDTNAKAFILDYYIAGKKKRITLGRYGELTPQQARDLAKDELAKIRKGEDPAERRRQARIEAQRSITVAEYAPIYIENARTRGNPGRKGRRPKKTWRDDELRIARHITPAWGKRRLDDITRQDARKLHASIGAKYEANRVAALVSIMWRAAVDLGYLEESHPNPAHDLTRNAETSRERFVTAAEMPELMKAIEAEDNAHIRAAILLYLMTGMRRSELCGLKWSDLDLQAATLRLGTTKNGEPLYLPLSSAALGVLASVPRLLGNPFVVASPVRHARPWNPDEITRKWRAVRERAGIEDVRLHDLRRTVGSWLAMQGANLPLIGSVLNHRALETTAIYARFATEAARSALDEHGARLAMIREAAKAGA
jgi:integrase